MQTSPPGSWGRPIGAVKARLLAGDWPGAESDAGWALETGCAEAGVADRPLRRLPRAARARAGRGGGVNAIINAFNAASRIWVTIAALTAKPGVATATSEDSEIRSSRLAPLPEGTQIGSDSVISQDIRLTKTFSFNESLKLDLIGEVFNVFNIANLTYPSAITLAEEGASPTLKNVIHRPFRAHYQCLRHWRSAGFQFAAKFRF